MSGSAPYVAAATVPRTCIRAQLGGAVGEGVGRAQPVALAGRRRGSPPRSRPARRRSTGSRPGSSGAGSCPAPRSGPAAGTAGRTRRSARRASPAPAGPTRRRGRSRRGSRARCVRGERRARCVRSRSSSHAPRVGVLAIVGHDVAVDPEHHAGGLEAQEQIVERLGVGGRRHGVGREPERHRRVGLDDGAVEHPRIARAHPHDAVGRARRSPAATRSRRWRSCRNRRSRSCSAPSASRASSLIGDDADVVGDAERRRRRRGDRRRRGTWRRRRGGARRPRRVSPDTRDVTRWAAPSVWYSLAAEEGDPARAEEAAMQDVVVVGLDLRPPGPFLEPRLRAAAAAPRRCRARSTRRRRTPTPGGAGRTDTRPASARRPRGDGRRA